VARETAAQKSERLLLSSGVTVTSVVGRRVSAAVRGDHGAVHLVRHNGGAWTCTCDAGPYRMCSHRLAVMKVCAPAGAVVLSPDAMVLIG
jgi:hypothetical protein